MNRDQANRDQALPMYSPSSVSMPLKTLDSYAPPKQSGDAVRLKSLKRLVETHEISPRMALKLRKLEAYDIVVICDDSGSMNTKSTAGLTVSNPFAPMPTRWGKESDGGAKKLLVLIATDRAPTNDSGEDDRDGLKHVLTNERPNKVPVVFLACTDDDEEVGYLDEWDTSIDGVDVVDDFYTERRQIKAVQGPQFPFSRGDWVCKMLLGPVDPEMDALDEIRVAREF
ncbi:hypothetical protein BJ741DRAFT_706082 [Chytriomyces cf. hyalinus JEL632]|nr:hypothetical protein BJ741DRAFT_706082 [Chytriomyces cf. hyalinus JEL632]